MKKVWGILIVGLGLVLMQSCTTSIDASSYEDYLTKSAMTYQAKAVSLNVAKKHGSTSAVARSGSGSNKSQEQANLMAMSSCTYLVTNLLPEAVNDCVITMMGTTITEEGKRITKALEVAEQEKKLAEQEELKNIEKEKQIKLTSLIDKAKNTCKTIGFKEDTEKFTDCTLKIYTQNVELAAEKKQTIVQSSSLSSGGSVTIYDPVRDYNAAIKRGQGLINGTCTLGDLSNC